MSFQRVRTGKSYVNKDDLPEFKNDSFYNIGIICDNSWDNYLIMNKYLKKIVRYRHRKDVPFFYP